MAEQDLRISRRAFMADSSAGVVLAALPGGFKNGAVAAGASDWAVRFPAPFPEATWLKSNQRLCFGVDAASLDEAVKAGTNVICGGTNAAGIGFAGGPFILGKTGEFCGYPPE